MSINLAAVYHEAKSKYAYAFDKDTVHIKIRTARGDVDKVRIIYGDPFNWGPKEKDINFDGNEWEWKNENNETLYMKKEYSTFLHDYYFISVKPKFRRIKYIFVLENEDEEILFGCRTILENNKTVEKDLFNYFNFPFLNAVDIFNAPLWVKNTVWYQIFPERFSNGNKYNDPLGVIPWNSIEKVRNNMFFGGDLEGIIQKLDYIKDLGATGIYFTPLFKSPSTHKYDIENYFEIDPQFGDLETMKTLVNEAHNRGIKVMLDAVFNHCGYNHPFFQDVIKNNENSKYVNYFHIKKFPVLETDPEDFTFIDNKSILNFDTFAFTPFMPKWNTEHPEVKKYLLDVAKFWIKECDIDAWRLDVSNEVDHKFWREFKEACESEKKDFFIVGENWDEANPWLKGDQMQSIMNYDFMFSCWNFFGNRNLDAESFAYDINRILTMYPKNVSSFLFNLLDSHDSTRVFNICEANIEKVKLAYLFLLTFAGTPSIYYGSEIGLSGAHDPDNRKCMIWDENLQNLNLRKHIQKLIKLRKNHSTFTEVDIKWIEANKETNHLIYEKESLNETVIFIINNNSVPLTLNAPQELKNKNVKDIYFNNEIIIKDKIYLNAFDFLILKTK